MCFDMFLEFLDIGWDGKIDNIISLMFIPPGNGVYKTERKLWYVTDYRYFRSLYLQRNPKPS